MNPLDVTQALAKGAKARGPRICENIKATRILAGNCRVCGVESSQGVIKIGKMLLAAGMWTARFAAQHGVTVPLHATEHFYIVTEPMTGFSRGTPTLVVAEERIYTKEDAGKLLIGGLEAQGKAWGQRGISPDFEFDELCFDMVHVEPLLGQMFAHFPQLAETGIETFFNGPESSTPDGRPYLGPAPEIPGLFIAAGMNSNGILNSGGFGMTMAHWMARGEPVRALGSLLAARAHPFQRNIACNAERGAESIDFHSGLHWPGPHVHSASGIRRVPVGAISQPCWISRCPN